MILIQNCRKEIDKEINSIKSDIKKLCYVEKIPEIQKRINKLYGRGISKIDNPEFEKFTTLSAKLLASFSILHSFFVDSIFTFYSAN